MYVHLRFAFEEICRFLVEHFTQTIVHISLKLHYKIQEAEVYRTVMKSVQLHIIRTLKLRDSSSLGCFNTYDIHESGAFLVISWCIKGFRHLLEHIITLHYTIPHQLYWFSIAESKVSLWGSSNIYGPFFVVKNCEKHCHLISIQTFIKRCDKHKAIAHYETFFEI